MSRIRDVCRQLLGVDASSVLLLLRGDRLDDARGDPGRGGQLFGGGGGGDAQRRR